MLDSLLMNLQPYRSDAQSPTGYQISQAMFAQNHADPTNTDPATWMWTGDSNPLSNQAGQANTTDNTVMDSHLLQEPEQDAKQIVAEIQQKTSEFEDRIENRITQVEERINNIQAG